MKQGVITALVLSLVVLSSVACQNKKNARTASGLNAVHFDFDSASIKPDMVRVMDGNSNYVKRHKNLNLVVEGHCDERGTNEYNLALGDRRAMSAKSYLVNKGVKESRLRTVSYGEERPVKKGSNETAWYINRRAEFVKQ